MSSNGVIRRTPIACGALGRYDPEVVAEIARCLEPELATVHRDRSSVLMLDRAPIRWRSGLTRGLSWSEGTGSAAPVRSWQDAACELNACGLVVTPRSRLVHSSVAGVAPIYHVDCGEATYFASRVDPLARAVPIRLSVDWDAWASILCLTHPVGGHTPFAEIKRLRPFATLRRRGGRGVAAQRRWPWSEIEPDLDAERGAPRAAERMREVVAGLPDGPAAVLLSGGLDSRLLLCLLTEARPKAVHALTMAHAGVDGWEERIAASVTAALGVPHEVCRPGDDTYWERWVEQVATMDFQYTLPLWISPIISRLGAERGIVGDGFGLDTLAQPGGRYVTREMLSPNGDSATALALWRRLRQRAMRGAHAETYSEELSGALTTASRRALLEATEPVRGHPAEALLSIYLTRGIHGVAVLPHAVFGGHCAIVTPFVDHRVATACLRVTPRAKFGRHLYAALFEAINPAVGRQPSTSEPTAELKASRRAAPPLRLLGGLAPKPVAAYARTLADGPLTPYLAPGLRDGVDAGKIAELIRGRGSRHRAVLATAAFHLWHERYRDRLRLVDPTELF